MGIEDKAAGLIVDVGQSMDVTSADISIGVKKITSDTELRIGDGNGSEVFIRKTGVDVAGFKGVLDVGKQSYLEDYHPLNGGNYLLQRDNFITSSGTNSHLSASYQGTRSAGSDTLTLSADIGTQGAHAGLELNSPMTSLDRTAGGQVTRDVNLTTGVDAIVRYNKDARVSLYGGITYQEGPVIASAETKISFGSRDNIVGAVNGTVSYDSSNGLTGYFSAQANTRGQYGLEAGVRTTRPVVTIAGQELVAEIGVGRNTRTDVSGQDGLGRNFGVGEHNYVRAGLSFPLK